MKSTIDIISKAFEDAGLDDDQNNQINQMMQTMNNMMSQMYSDKTPAEINELTKSANELFGNIFGRLNFPLETKIVSQKEFLVYKLVNDDKICPELRSWKWENDVFSIKYKECKPLHILTEKNKEFVVNLIMKIHNMGIFYGGVHKDNIVYNEYEGIKLIDFSNSCSINGIDEQFLLNNPYGTPCHSIEELLNLELKAVEDIFELKLNHIF